MAPKRLPLSFLLSQVLVTLTIEIDNTYESRAPHRTNLLGGAGPWLTSYGMWANFLRLVPTDGIAVRDLASHAGWAKSPHPAQAGMQRWGYVTVDAAGETRTSKAERIVKPTRAGRISASTWAPLAAEIENRWVDRFGPTLIVELRDRAAGAVELLDLRLPAYLPLLGWDMSTAAPASDRVVPGDPGLVTAVANLLHAFAIDYERDAPVGLAAAANVLRVVDQTGIRTRDIPILAGISAEAAAWATGVLGHGYVTIEADPSARQGKVVRLTARGAGAQAAYEPRAAAVEDDWASRLGAGVARLRANLEEIIGRDGGDRLRYGMQAPDGCWRATTRRSAVIPHFPVVMHRGAFPDGA